ncbi:MAG: SRPBCC family protein [Saprospiraceae bacterium]|nr:SRPBCC family protein [Saprospiraceae bacterium]
MLSIIYIIIAIIAAVVLGSFIAPKTFSVEREILINKPKAEVFSYLRSLKNQDHWSVWATRDPNMEKRLTGQDGQVGATSYWNGNKEVGEGEQEIKHIEEGKRIDTQLRFIKPFKSQSDAYFITEDTTGGTQVKWGFSGVMKPPSNLFLLLSNMDKTVGADFEKGLSNLKTVLEAEKN